ncbi:MAG: acyl-CoA dehydrogenase family protein [Gemmatimonadales bacterium]|nr:acyl-CoA dehydrogenase family protein [Gemmatimonadales bacterium]
MTAVPSAGAVVIPHIPVVEPPTPRMPDFFGVDGLLGDAERAVRDEVRAWVDARVMPIIAECWLENRFPRELLPEMARLHLFGPSIPAEYGGGGKSGVEYGLMMQELERADSGIRSFCSVQSSLVMYPIHAFGSEAQRRRWLPGLAAATEIGCFGLTEPDVGSNPAGMTVRATRTADGWTLTGRKKWLSNGPMATVAVVWAQTGEVGDHRAVRGFIVPTDTKGVTVHHITDKYSLRVSPSSAMDFDDVHLPADALLPGVEGLKGALMCLNQARYGIVWGALGAAIHCYEEALAYGKQRVMFGRPIAGFQLQQDRLVDMLSEIVKAQLLALQLGRLKDAGQLRPEQISLAKRNNVDIACDAAREARRLLGANGILSPYHAMRHMADLESVYTYEGTHDMHTLIVGQAVTGENAFA